MVNVSNFILKNCEFEFWDKKKNCRFYSIRNPSNILIVLILNIINYWLVIRWNSWNHFGCDIEEKVVMETGIYIIT